jgi:hypothetical protein
MSRNLGAHRECAAHHGLDNGDNAAFSGLWLQRTVFQRKSYPQAAIDFIHSLKLPNPLLFWILRFKTKNTKKFLGIGT